MNRWGWWCGIGVLVLLVVVTAGSPPGGFWAPDGYVAKANAIIASGGLQLECGIQDSIAPKIVPGTPEERFFRASYLRADVRRFNQNPGAARSPFLVDGCNLLGVDPYYHRIDLPYNRIPRWTGTIRFARAGGSASLTGASDQNVEISPRGKDGTSDRVVRVDPSQGGTRVRGDFVRIEVPGTREVAADAYMIGGNAVTADRRDVASPASIRLNGFRLPPGRVARLETGDWLQVGSTVDPYTYIVHGPETGEVISSAVRRGEGWERRHRIPRLSPFLTNLGQAIEAGLLSTPSARDQGRVTKMDLRLTLDRQLELETEDVLAQWCREERFSRRPRGVSAIIMDAFTGDVQAMPSCPDAVELESYGPLSRRLTSRFLRNQNLVSHPVGSGLKPFWAAAIGTSYPRFLDLEIPAHTDVDVEDVLGCRLGSGYASAAHDDWEGMEHFIQTSCNRFMIELASAALIADRGTACDPGTNIEACFQAGSVAPAGAPRSTPVRFCDQIVNLVLAPGLSVTGETCDDLRLVDAAFAPAGPLAGITGGHVYREAAPVGTLPKGLDPAYRAGRYRLDLWRGPIEALQAAGDTAATVTTALRFASVSPQASNLALNTVEDLRSDWVNLLLGGENSRWSNLELAEATARLMTGRDVRARLVQEVGANPTPRDLAPLLPVEVLHPGARRRVLHAMEKVVEPGGTGVRIHAAARRLRVALEDVPGAEGYELKVFAKTGTPAVEIPLGEGAESREGSVLVMGLVLVPRDAGTFASARVGDFVSACPISPDLRQRILAVPPADLLDPGRSVGITMAVFLDDLDPEGGDGRAAQLGQRLLDAMSPFLLRSLVEKLPAR